MPLRSRNDVETAFRWVEAQLDTQLEAARAELTRAGIAILDRSNRGGFERSGFPDYTWSHAFRSERRLGAEIALATAVVSYREPLERELLAVNLEWRAEVFSIGATSRVDERHETTLPLEKLSLGRAVVQLLASAEEALARRVTAP